jgi:hypothetical protein
VKAKTKVVICAIGLSMMITSCAYFRPPNQDQAYAEMQRKEKEGPIPPGEQAWANLISNVWMGVGNGLASARH